MQEWRRGIDRRRTSWSCGCCGAGNVVRASGTGGTNFTDLKRTPIRRGRRVGRMGGTPTRCTMLDGFLHQSCNLKRIRAGRQPFLGSEDMCEDPAPRPGRWRWTNLAGRGRKKAREHTCRIAIGLLEIQAEYDTVDCGPAADLREIQHPAMCLWPSDQLGRRRQIRASCRGWMEKRASGGAPWAPAAPSMMANVARKARSKGDHCTG
ncbi:hypothetical protein LXA43DRAFT_298646 [Ganoderma leucocontextum]|nr:hypothetical protein LXA43DRAFT_298646 [Ganoderma leucocontextum]